MIERSSALTSAGLRYTDERGTANNRHCWDIGSTGFISSTIARRSAPLSSRAFVPKRSYEGRPIELFYNCRLISKEPAAMARQETVGSLRTVYAAIELSKKSWVLGIARPDRDRPSIHRLTGGDIGALVRRLRGATVQDQRIVVCYEGGYDGFWLARSLARLGIECRVLDPARQSLPRCSDEPSRARSAGPSRPAAPRSHGPSLPARWRSRTDERQPGHRSPVAPAGAVPAD